ncbi:endoplasmic reticulum vesicle transporter-domain-containing protein [Pilobolus umbonatus]|nr:endoplasmic reticulum vesicle transporter-domain-containing protein [Pilobolus umbonatus]
MARKGTIFGGFRQLDGYGKTLDDFRIKTTTGALVTIFSAIIILILALSELSAYRSSSWNPRLVIDKSRKEMMPINFDITFPHLPCHLLNIDIMDETGLKMDSQNINKVRLDTAGNPIESENVKLGDGTKDMELVLSPPTECGSCYGANALNENGCCNTCQEVRESYIKMGWGTVNMEQIEQCKREGWIDRLKNQADEGCNIYGNLRVNKVRGNFHIAPGEVFRSNSAHVHDLNEFNMGSADGHKFDTSHTIHKLKFGPDSNDESILEVTNPLGGTTQVANGHTIYQYFLKIVSTELLPHQGIPTYTNQYSVIQNQKPIKEGQNGLPGLFFYMDISPMHIIYQETKPSFISLVTGILGIIGGVFTVAGLVDRVVYKAERVYKKKVSLGKTL